MYYPKNPCITGSILNLFYLRTVSANLKLLYFLWCSNKECFFPKRWKSKVEILFMLISWVYLYFPQLSAFYVLRVVSSSAFPSGLTHVRIIILYSLLAMSTEIYYIYKFTRLINCQILSVLLWDILETVMYHSRFLILFIDFLSYYVIGLWLHFFSYYHKSESYKRRFPPRKKTQFVAY
jgi:hypothetical protein